ncbi:MAG: serine hydrolase domain-containing protein [Phycisphaerales bacterium]
MLRTRIPLLAAAVAVACLTATGASAADPRPFADDPALAPLPARGGALTDLCDVPGAAIVVVKDGETFIHTLGVRDPDTGAPVTPDTMFYIASITKTYLATGVVKLAGEGRIDLDAPVKTYLPRFRLADSQRTETITVRDLLSHRLGVTGGPIVFLDAYTGDITDDRYWFWLERGGVAGELEYTNIHYTLLGRIVEAVTGKDWRDYLDEAIFTPAGMRRTTGYASAMYTDPDCAIPSERIGERFAPTPQRKTDRTMHAAGGLGTTAADAARYMTLHLNGGQIDGARILPEDGAAEMLTLQAERDEHRGTIRIEKGFGLGWGWGDYANQEPIRFHGGGYVGTSAWFCMLPEQNAALGVLINAGGAARPWMDIVAIDILECLTGIAPPWSPFDEIPPQIRERKAQQPAPTPPTPWRPATLTRPLGMYTGAFHNEHLGSIIIERDGDALTVRAGDMTMEAGDGDNPDEALLRGAFDPPATLRFVVGPAGKIDQIRLIDADLGDLAFVR